MSAVLLPRPSFEQMILASFEREGEMLKQYRISSLSYPHEHQAEWSALKDGYHCSVCWQFLGNPSALSVTTSPMKNTRSQHVNTQRAISVQ